MRAAHPQGGRSASNSYPFGHPQSHAYAFNPFFFATDDDIWICSWKMTAVVCFLYDDISIFLNFKFIAVTFC
jgi:hypothetical protein